MSPRAAAAFASIALLAASARAQAPPTSGDAEEARHLFERALEELRRGDFASARDRFRASLRLHAHAATAYNLALALESTGELREAERLLARLEDGAFGALDEARGAEVRDVRARVRANLAAVRLSLDGPIRADLRVDGVRDGALEAGRERAVRLDPGRHVLRAEALGYDAAEQEVELGRGEERRLALSLVPSPDASPRDDGADETALVATLGVGGALLVAGGVLLALAFTTDVFRPGRLNDDRFGSVEVLAERAPRPP